MLEGVQRNSYRCSCHTGQDLSRPWSQKQKTPCYFAVAPQEAKLAAATGLQALTEKAVAATVHAFRVPALLLDLRVEIRIPFGNHLRDEGDGLLRINGMGLRITAKTGPQDEARFCSCTTYTSMTALICHPAWMQAVQAKPSRPLEGLTWVIYVTYATCTLRKYAMI